MDWVYSVGFKKPRSDKLKWLITTSQDVVEASKQAVLSAAKRGWLNAGYREYGHSKTMIKQ